MSSEEHQGHNQEQRQLLEDLGKFVERFKLWLDTAPRIDTLDQISIDNHLSALVMCYGVWKVKHGPARRSAGDKGRA